jgi:hypothetical protein
MPHLTLFRPLPPAALKNYTSVVRVWLIVSLKFSFFNGWSNKSFADASSSDITRLLLLMPTASQEFVCICIGERYRKERNKVR